MAEKSTRLADRRQYLVSQAAAQRIVLARNIEPLRIPLARVDLGIAAVRYLKNHPAWLLGGGALLVGLRPSRILKWLRRGWLAWQVVRQLHSRQM